MESRQGLAASGSQFSPDIWPDDGTRGRFVCDRQAMRPSILINSDGCGVFGTRWAEQFLVAEACNHPNLLILPFSFELVHAAA